MNKKGTVRGKARAKRAAAMPQEKGLDLSTLFGAATQALASNQTSLNMADTENQNHGDNMVQAFSMIQQALAGQSGTPSQQLNHASQYLSQHANTGSAHVYSQGLAQAAQQLQGQQTINPNNAGMLIQALLGGEQQPAGGGADMLTSLLGGSGQQGGAGGMDMLTSLLGGGQPQQPMSQPSGAGDLLGSLLGGGAAQQQAGQQDNGFDIGDVINAGLTFMNAKQQGQNTLQAALSAIMATGPMGQKPYRQQSGQIVANALLQALTSMGRK